MSSPVNPNSISPSFKATGNIEQANDSIVEESLEESLRRDFNSLLQIYHNAINPGPEHAKVRCVREAQQYIGRTYAELETFVNEHPEFKPSMPKSYRTVEAEFIELRYLYVMAIRPLSTSITPQEYQECVDNAYMELETFVNEHPEFPLKLPEKHLCVKDEFDSLISWYNMTLQFDSNVNGYVVINIAYKKLEDFVKDHSEFQLLLPEKPLTYNTGAST